LKLGVYGGTFDPVHMAHLILAEFACDNINLDKLLFIPSYLPPHKLNARITPAQHRRAMLTLALQGNDHFEICDYEIANQGPSYTIDTLKYIQKEYGLERNELFLIIGADNMKDFHRWKDPQRITEMAQVVVAERPQYDPQNGHFPSIVLNSPLIEISASQIRENIRRGKSITYLTPPSVEAYIYKHKLYR